MKILKNPDSGAPIHDFVFLGTAYFTKDEGEFMPGSVFQFEDDRIADAFLNNYGFLETITTEEAKRFMETEVLKCDKCDFTTRHKGQFTLHGKKHEAEKELSNIGIPIIKKKQSLDDLNETISSMQKQIDSQEAIDRQDRQDGLEGEGLIDDKPQKNVIMS